MQSLRVNWAEMLGGHGKEKDTALKGKRDQIVGNRKSWQLTAT